MFRYLFFAFIGLIFGSSYAAQYRDFGNSVDGLLVQSTSPTVLSSIQEIRDDISKEGAARIIVGLRVPIAGIDELTKNAEDEQNARIKSAQNYLISALGRSPEASKNDIHYDFIPFSSIYVNSSELDKILTGR